MPFITQGKTNWKLLIIVIILAIIVGVVVLWYAKRPEKPYQPVQIKKLDETANWKTYRNEKYGYEIKYPMDWASGPDLFLAESIVFCPSQFADPDPSIGCKLLANNGSSLPKSSAPIYFSMRLAGITKSLTSLKEENCKSQSELISGIQTEINDCNGKLTAFWADSSFTYLFRLGLLDLQYKEIFNKMLPTFNFNELAKTAKCPNIKFEDYPVSETYQGKIAEVDFESAPEYKDFFTVITNEAKKGPNFAGKYKIITWGCGSPCQNNIIIDSQTGKIIDGFNSAWGSDYKIDSSLIISDIGGSEGATVDYLELKDNKLKLVCEAEL